MLPARPIDFNDLRLAAPSKTLRFEGADHASGVSWFFVDNVPGQGAETHRHPYTETWLVLAGEVEIRIGVQIHVLQAEQTIVVPPLVWHSFTVTGRDRLRMLCIHACDRIVQEFLNEVGEDAVPFERH